MNARSVDLVLGGARLSGAVANAYFVVDQQEHCRRGQAHITAVTRLDVLDDLLRSASQEGGQTPIGEQLSLDPLDRLTQPGRVVLVEVRAGRNARRALDRAFLFARIVPVRVVTSWPEDGISDLALEASALGVGLVVEAGDVREVLVQPGQPHGIFDAATWAFHERVYEVWLRRQRPADLRGSVRAHRAQPAA